MTIYMPKAWRPAPRALRRLLPLWQVSVASVRFKVVVSRVSRRDTGGGGGGGLLGWGSGCGRNLKFRGNRGHTFRHE